MAADGGCRDGAEHSMQRERRFSVSDLQPMVYGDMRRRIRTSTSTISRSGRAAASKQVTEGTVDFGASDATMTDDQMAQAKVKVMALPTVLGAVVPIYNIPGLQKPAELLRRRESRTSTWARLRSGAMGGSPRTTRE